MQIRTVTSDVLAVTGKMFGNRKLSLNYADRLLCPFRENMGHRV